MASFNRLLLFTSILSALCYGEDDTRHQPKHYKDIEDNVMKILNGTEVVTVVRGVYRMAPYPICMRSVKVEPSLSRQFHHNMSYKSKGLGKELAKWHTRTQIVQQH
ncbi:uncharacterized protein LOC119399564 [Rhipicephalus sanguineus]|uniref:uncharacterized protein LOC119399564 n=1 Tax=Rhipicephalus sanguineus TaxID=34632 RepID=UPI0020C3A087|nr:uncharacterized protein LOC119399564 [Rhipicephalus sanguineus]